MAEILSLERTGNEAIQQIQLGALFLGELSLVARNALIGGQRHALPHPPRGTTATRVETPLYL